MGLAEGWTVFGIVLVAGGLAIDPGAGLVLLGFAPLGFGPASHGGFATVDVVPLGRDVPPDAAVVLEVGTPLALEPVLPVVEVVLPGEVEVVEVPEAVALLLAGVHGATVGVVPLGFWVALVPVVPPVTAPGLPATPGVPCVGAGAPIELVPGCEAGVPVVGCVVVVVPGCDCVVDVPVWVPIPELGVAGLGVTVPVLCAVAMLTARANTDDANKIFRIGHAPC